MAGLKAGLEAYNAKALVPMEEYGWDDYYYRIWRYSHYESYYLNTVYSSLLTYAGVHKETEGLYHSIRGIYNPVSRQNDLLSSYVYGGGIDMERLQTGAIPIVTDNEALRDAIRQLFIWSRWGENKTLFVRWGARLGDVAIKLVDDRERRRVRMEVLHPGKIREAQFDEVGNVKSVIIEYERTEDPDVSAMQAGKFGVKEQGRKSYVYTEKIDREKFQTFKNGEPFPYFNDANGNPVAEWDNEYGFVPLVIASHKQTGLQWGANAFHNALRKIDEINDAASLINDQVRKSVNLIWYFAGVRQTSEITTNTVDAEGRPRKDVVPALYGPADSQPFPMVGNLPIDQALNNMREMLLELERDMPELSLQRIREGGSGMTAPGVRSGYSDAIGRIEEAQGNYDHALIRASQMGVSMGGYNGYDGFQGFTLDSYDRGDLDFWVKPRPVIADELTKQERVTALQGAGSQPVPMLKLILRELDYDDKTIEDTTAEIEAEKERNTTAALRGFSQGVFGQDDEEDDGDDTEPTESDEEIEVAAQAA